MQAVAEFVEQGDHVVVRQQRGFAVHAIGEVADQMGHRRLQRAVVGPQPAGAHIVHPGAAAFAGAGGRVEVELPDQLRALCGAALNAEELHARVPDRRAVGADRHFEQRLDDLEQASEHLGRGEIGFDLLLAEGVARLLELFADEGPVPGLRVAQAQVLGGKRAHVGQVLLGIRPGFLGQVAQKGHHLLGRLGHLGHQRDVGVVAVAEQCGFFLPQRQQLGHDLAVFELGSVARGLLARAGDVGAVELFAQGPMGAKLHDGQVDRHLEAEFVAGFALGLGGGRGGGNHVLGHAVELLAFHIERKAVGRVERVFAELLAQLGLALLDGGKTFLGRALQLGAAERKAA